jgi:hypothetical protein
MATAGLLLDRITRIMTEEGGDGLHGHPPVDCLGGQGVAELVGMNVGDAGASGDGGDVAVDGAAVEGSPVVAFDEAPRTRSGAGGSVVVNEFDQRRQQWHVAVVVQLADGDAHPVGVADEDHGVVLEAGQLTGADPGAGQDLDHEPPTGVGIGGEGGHELRGGGVVEELRERFVALGEVTGEDRDAGRGIVVAGPSAPR